MPGGDQERAGEVTRLLQRLPTEREAVEPRLLELLGDQLHAVAASMMARERAGHTLQPTLLVDEAWMRMGAQRVAGWRNREQFLALAAQAMRRLLLNHARDRAAAKRGAGGQPEVLESILAYYEDRRLDLLAVDEALGTLAAEDEAAARVVELRFFGGLSLPEVAQVMGVSLRTVERGWTRARLTLRKELE
jgi:RNA polymerase sigma factor (TIGR02999 family)